MDEQYLLYIKNFEEHLAELSLCNTKLNERASKFSKHLLTYEERLNQISVELNVLFLNFKNQIENVNIDILDNTIVKLTLLREKNDFFVNSYSVLSSNETEDKKQLKQELSRLNLLLEATTKIRMFIEDRKGKLIDKFSNENHNKLIKIDADSKVIADVINATVCILNAKAAFTFSLEMEVSSRFQTLEAICADLKKKIK